METLHTVGKLFTELCSARQIIQSTCVKFFSRLRGSRVSAAALKTNFKLFWPDGGVYCAGKNIHLEKFLSSSCLCFLFLSRLFSFMIFLSILFFFTRL